MKHITEAKALSRARRLAALLLTTALLLTACLTLVACGGPDGSDPTLAEKALRDSGYEVMISRMDDASYITATHPSGGFISITYYKDENTAKGMWDAIKDDVDDIIDDLADTYKVEKGNFKYGRNGRAVYFGTKDAVKASET